jgi:hypothetical protein
MSFEFPCTHPAEWECKQSEAGCVVQIQYEASIAAEAEMARARAEGRELYINRDSNPNIVGNVDMTDNDRKESLAPSGTSYEVPLPPDFNDVPDVDHDALEYWRRLKER